MRQALSRMTITPFENILHYLLYTGGYIFLDASQSRLNPLLNHTAKVNQQIAISVPVHMKFRHTKLCLGFNFCGGEKRLLFAVWFPSIGFRGIISYSIDRFPSDSIPSICFRGIISNQSFITFFFLNFTNISKNGNYLNISHIQKNNHRSS